MNFESGKVFDYIPRKSINPYLAALGIIIGRLNWDLNPLSWKARKKIKVWKEKYAGQKAVILCNGPSLNKTDFSLLQKSSIFTFGLNKINLLFERSDFRPSCIVSVNPFVIEQNKNFYNTTDIPLFIDARGRKWVAFRKNVHFLHSGGISGQFARDCSVSICQGFTVTYVAMQLAFHMGFIDVALVGCDHYFQSKGPPNKQVQAGKIDYDHFDPRYFSDSAAWQLPDLTASEFHYEKARNIFNHFGRRLVNCTDGGQLEKLERMPLDAFLNG